MEAQLAAYRARKAKEKAASQGSWLSFRLSQQTSQTSHSETSQDDVSKENDLPDGQADLPRTSSEQDTSYLTTNQSYFSTDRLLKLLLWLCLLGAFVFLGLGGVFLLISVFFRIYSSMGSNTRKKGELSAYSVFNPNCQRLQGQLTAEQFERELKYGSGAT